MPTNIKITELTKFFNRCFQAIGVSNENASVITNHLVDAEMRGIYSHGLNRLGWYLDLFQAGELEPTAVPSI